MKIYYKQQQFLRQAHRQIKNYDNGANSPVQTASPTPHQQQYTNNSQIGSSVATVTAALSSVSSTSTSNATQTSSSNLLNSNRRSRNLLLDTNNENVTTSYLNSSASSNRACTSASTSTASNRHSYAILSNDLNQDISATSLNEEDLLFDSSSYKPNANDSSSSPLLDNQSPDDSSSSLSNNEANDEYLGNSDSYLINNYNSHYRQN